MKGNARTAVTLAVIAVAAYLGYRWWRGRQGGGGGAGAGLGSNLNSVAPELIGGSAGPDSAPAYTAPTVNVNEVIQPGPPPQAPVPKGKAPV